MPYLGIVALAIAAWWWHRTALRRGARRMQQTVDALYGGAHQRRLSSLDRFPRLDRGFYEAATARLQAAGFVMLGDIEDLTVNALPVTRPTILRVLRSADGITTAAIYESVMRGVAALLVRLQGGPWRAQVVELETVLDDGTFLGTGNAFAAAAIDQPPQIRVLHLPPGTTVDELLARHAERLREALAAVPGVAPVPVTTLEEALHHQDRSEEIKAAFRRARGGGLSGEEIVRTAMPGQEAVARQLAEEMQRQRQAGEPGSG